MRNNRPLLLGLLVVSLLLISYLVTVMRQKRITTTPRASGTSVTYSMKAGSCTTNATTKECTLTISKNEVTEIQFVFDTGNAESKISAIDFFMRFNAPPSSSVLSYEGYRAQAIGGANNYFDTEIAQQVRDFNGAKMLHLILAAKKPRNELSHQVILTVRLKGAADGKTSVTFVPEASIIAGPPIGVYEILPKNYAANADGSWNTQNNDRIALYKTTVQVGSVSPTVQPTGTTISPTRVPSPTTGQNPTATPTGTNPTTPPGSNPTATPPNTTPSVTPTPSGSAFEMITMLRGITKKTDVCPSKKFTITVDGGELTSKVTKTVELTASASGAFSGTFNLDVPSGDDYTFYVKGPQHMQKKFTGVSVATGITTLDLSEVPLEPGDLSPQDGTLNVSDIQKLTASLLKKDSDADVNCDGIVNANDYGLIIATMETQYSDEN